MDLSKVLSLGRRFTQWHSLFPIEFKQVLHYLQVLVRELYDLALQLDIPHGVREAIEADFPTDAGRRRRELVKAWLSSYKDLPCWWHLVQALKEIGRRAIADDIEREHSKDVKGHTFGTN